MGVDSSKALPAYPSWTLNVTHGSEWFVLLSLFFFHSFFVCSSFGHGIVFFFDFWFWLSSPIVCCTCFSSQQPGSRKPVKSSDKLYLTFSAMRLAKVYINKINKITLCPTQFLVYLKPCIDYPDNGIYIPL